MSWRDLPEAAAASQGDRSFRIEPALAHDGSQCGFSVRTYRTFRLHLTGTGHWCGAAGGWCTYLDEAEAERVGRAWVEIGIQPSEQGNPGRSPAERDDEAIVAVRREAA